jgi:D-alanyl-D-alanine carboxypeptidase
MRRSVAVLLAATAALSTLTAGVAVADTDRRPDPTTLQRDADALLDVGAPGVLVELSTPEGRTQVRSGSGNVAAGSPVPWNAKFRIGSYTKTFVASTVLQLVGEGRLGLEDTVERWLPGVVAGSGNDGNAITVRQLLQHTSGLPEYLLEMPWLFTQAGFEENRFRRVTPQEAVALAMKHAPNFAPGTDWQYSNTNYMLAGMVVESVTGRDWRDEVRARILEPLGLRETFVPGDDPSIPHPHAVGYERFPGPGATPEDPRYGEPIDATEQNVSWGGAAGEIISTPRDGNRFLQALLSGKVLRPAELAEMKKTVAAPAFEGNWPGARYGLGLLHVPNSCGGSWGHGGDIMGFMTRNGATEDGTRSVMVSLNTDSLKPKEGVPPVTTDPAIDLVEHALCGTR